MGCVPSSETRTTPKINQQTTTANNNHNNPILIFTSDERLRLKEVWVVVKQNGLKKLGDDIMNKYIEIFLRESFFFINILFFSFLFYLKSFRKKFIIKILLAKFGNKR